MNPKLDNAMNKHGSPSKSKYDLIFDSNFESGNLDRVYKVKDLEYDLFMRVDTNTSGHHQWFNFSCDYHSYFKGKTVTFTIKNFTKEESLYNAGMRISMS